MRPRVQKLLRDAWIERGRFAALVAAIAAAATAVGAVFGAWAVLTGELGRNYLDTHPADATLALAADVDADVLAEVRSRPGIAVAEAGEVLPARFATAEGWHSALVFAADDRDHQLAVAFPEAGARDLPDGSVALERTAAALFGVGVGDTVRLRFPDGGEATLPVASIVHDPGLAPAWQEESAYVYASRATLSGALGRPVALHDLRVRWTDRASTDDVDAAATDLAAALTAEGRSIEAIRVPPFARHPHERQMRTMLLVLGAFAFVSLALASVVVTASIDALLARQVREIGVMKTLGATTGQIAIMYAGFVVAIGAVAVGIALPLGTLGAMGLSAAVANLINFTIARPWPPAWVAALVTTTSIGAPLVISALPLARAAGITVREALDRQGATPSAVRPWMASWPRVVRSVVRRPWRTATSLGLLAAAGAAFITAQNVSASWEAIVGQVSATRHDDVEVRFAAPVVDRALDPLRSVAGVTRVESWGWAPAALVTEGRVRPERVWPDRGHGSLAVVGVPAGSTVLSLPITSGRWLEPAGGEVAVVNQGMLAHRPGLRVGDPLEIVVEGRPARFVVIGIVEEIGSPGGIYVPRTSFPGSADATAIRVVGGDPAEVEAALAGTPVSGFVPRDELEHAVGGHVSVLVAALNAMAAVMAVVGGSGIASAAAVQVLERTREIGITKTLGGTPALVGGRFLAEAAFVAVVSVPLAWALAVPLSLGLDELVGSLGFLAPLPFVFDWVAAFAWVGVALGLTVLATASSAARAGSMTVREALDAT